VNCRAGLAARVVSELLTERNGIGELSLLMPALAQLSRQDDWLMLIAPPWIPYAPALAARGIRLSRLIVANTTSDKDTLWATEQSLRAAIAPLCWPGPLPSMSTACGDCSLPPKKAAASAWCSAIFTRGAFFSGTAALRLGVWHNRLAVKILKAPRQRADSYALAGYRPAIAATTKVLNHGGHGEKTRREMAGSWPLRNFRISGTALQYQHLGK